MFVSFQCRWLTHLEVYCSLTIETWLKLNIHFDDIYLNPLNACRFSLVIILLNARDRNKSKYISFVFLSIYHFKLIK